MGYSAANALRPVEQAIVSWGVAAFQEGTRGTNPEGTQIIGNYAHEIGPLEKQVQQDLPPQY